MCLIQKFLLLAIALEGGNALALADNRPADVCDLKYGKGEYHVFKGDTAFSIGIQKLDDAIGKMDGLVSAGVCRHMIGTCSLKFDPHKGGRYFISKDKKRFTGAFPTLARAEAVLEELSYNQVCVTPEEEVEP